MQSIEINSSNSSTDKNNVLRYKFTQSIKLEGYCKLASCNMWYNWKNVRKDLQNHVYAVGRTDTPDTNPRTVTIPDGSYSIKHLNEFIKWELKKAGEEVDYDILKANVVSNRVTVTLKDNLALFLGGGLNYMLGGTTSKHESVKLEAPLNKNFDHVPKIENVTSVNINCNIVNNRYQTESKLLYQFTPSVSYGSLIFLEPRSVWKQTRQAYENEIEIRLTDQDGMDLDIEDTMSFTVVIADENFIKR